jgi:hypothetical protein
MFRRTKSRDPFDGVHTTGEHDAAIAKNEGERRRLEDRRRELDASLRGVSDRERRTEIKAEVSAAGERIGELGNILSTLRERRRIAHFNETMAVPSGGSPLPLCGEAGDRDW